ncbi:MAG: TlyA family RNA methyltransferase, partial [bacterium]|nr:TlyA family RNA methyltransferase [bacterium]
DAEVSLKSGPCPYVSRGGLKLRAALDAFTSINVLGRVCLDVGASTGGFTDCLLQNGAAHVLALDVGYGQIAWSLRNDPRVEVVERTNFRTVDVARLGERFDLVTIDASFISLLLLLERAREALRPEGRIVGLIKPQFEAGPERVGPGGVVRDPEIHEAILREVRDGAAARGISLRAIAPSPLRGPAGNIEFLGLFLPGQGEPPSDGEIAGIVRAAHGRSSPEGGDS